MTTASLSRQFAEQGARLPESPDILKLKHEAWERFSASGFPSRRDENWRYTDLKPIADAEYALMPPQPDRALIERVGALLASKELGHESTPRCVFIDGHYAPELSRPDAAGDIRVERLAANWNALRWERTGHGGQEHPLATLNTAFTEQGLVVSVDEYIQAANELHLVFVGSERSGIGPQPRLGVELGTGAELVVVQHFVDLAPARSWLNLVTDVRQAAESKFRLYRFQEHGDERSHSSLLRARLGKDASLSAGYIELGGRWIRNDFDVQLDGTGSSAELFGVSLASGGQHVDNHLRVDHRAANTRSDEAFRSIVGERGRGVFNGKIVVHRDAQQVDARQSSDNLLLAQDAEVDTKPELEIYADDVKCSHGATIGELDEQQLFYLRTRGLDAELARNILTFAFANTILQRIFLSDFRERVATRLLNDEHWTALL